jgi:hypothetical protein
MGSLTVRPVCMATEHKMNAPGGLHRDLLVSAIVLPFFKPRFVVPSAG